MTTSMTTRMTMNIFGLTICCFVALVCCTKPLPVDPVSEKSTQQTLLDMPAIDPDQRALPRELVEGVNREVAVAIPAEVPVAIPAEVPVKVDVPSNAESIERLTVTRPASHTPPSADITPSSAISHGSGPQILFINAAVLTIRSQPNRNSKVIGYVKGGDEVHVKLNGHWACLDAGRFIRSRWLVKVRPTKFSGSDDRSDKLSSTPREEVGPDRSESRPSNRFKRRIRISRAEKSRIK